MDFGTRLRQLREERRWSRDDLAQQLKSSYSAIAKYESNTRFPDQKTLVLIADLFNVSVDFLLGRTPTDANSRGSNGADSEIKALITNFRFIPQMRELTRVIPNLSEQERSTLLELMYTVIKPTLFGRNPWLKRLPADLQAKMIPLAAMEWHSRYAHADGKSDPSDWSDEALVAMCEIMIQDYEEWKGRGQNE